MKNTLTKSNKNDSNVVQVVPEKIKFYAATSESGNWALNQIPLHGFLCDGLYHMT